MAAQQFLDALPETTQFNVFSVGAEEGKYTSYFHYDGYTTFVEDGAADITRSAPYWRHDRGIEPAYTVPIEGLIEYLPHVNTVLGFVNESPEEISFLIRPPYGVFNRCLYRKVTLQPHERVPCLLDAHLVRREAGFPCFVCHVPDTFLGAIKIITSPDVCTGITQDDYCIEICKQRTIRRTELFKKELVEKCWHPERLLKLGYFSQFNLAEPTTL